MLVKLGKIKVLTLCSVMLYGHYIDVVIVHVTQRL